MAEYEITVSEEDLQYRFPKKDKAVWKRWFVPDSYKKDSGYISRVFFEHSAI